MGIYDETMPDASIQVTGVRGPVVVKSDPFTGQHTVSADGQPIQRGKNGKYPLPATDGGTVEAKVSSNFLNPSPTLEVDGNKYSTAPALPLVLQILMLLPLALVFVGGLVGGLIGAVGVGVNTLVARSGQSAAIKALMMVGVLVLAVLVWMAAIQVISRAV
jgi:hypothetical protein